MVVVETEAEVVVVKWPAWRSGSAPPVKAAEVLPYYVDDSVAIGIGPNVYEWTSADVDIRYLLNLWS